MNYAIACGHVVTAQAAEQILQAGGNAIDAVIAAFAASWVAEPCMSSPGGGAFAMIYFDGHLSALDCFAKTPAKKRSRGEANYIPITVDFGGTQEVFYSGLGSVAVPGAIDGMYQLHRMGATMPMSALMGPALHNAKHGVAVNTFQHYDLTLLGDIVKLSDRGRALFYPDGDLVPLGAKVAMPFLADFIDYLSREGRDAFYQGEVASKIVAASQAGGGHIDAGDLRDYTSCLSTPLTCGLRGTKVHTHGTPSIGGHMLQHLLKQYRKTGAYDIDELINALTHLTAAQESGVFDQSLADTGGLKPGGTSHISVVDRYNNAVSLSMSIGEGSGHFVEGTDIHLNNMLGEESLLPDGIHSWRENGRMASMMTPTILLNKESKMVAAFGSGGASRIPSMIGQVLYHHIMREQTLSGAIEYPRLHFIDKVWQSEPGIGRPSYIAPGNWNGWDKPSLYFGGVHCAAAVGGRYDAIGDSRRTGVGLAQ